MPKTSTWLKLTKKQRAFVKAWAETGVVRQAEQIAGIEHRYAASLAKREDIQLAVTELLDKVVTASSITAADIQERLWHEGTTAESDTARVNALMGLAKIKGMLRGTPTIDTITVIRAEENNKLLAVAQEGETDD